VLVFFFTFLTHDNAIEIVISGVASVFIGIGVNNYSSFETHIKDEQQMQSKLRNALDMMDLIQMQSHRILEETNNGQMVELNKMIAICKRMLEEDY
jgi:ABC-type uncharacterized transport system permease subunit